MRALLSSYDGRKMDILSKPSESDEIGPNARCISRAAQPKHINGQGAYGRIKAKASKKIDQYRITLRRLDNLNISLSYFVFNFYIHTTGCVEYVEHVCPTCYPKKRVHHSRDF